MLLYKIAENKEKQPLEVFYEKRSSWKFPKIPSKTPVSGSLFLIKLQAKA